MSTDASSPQDSNKGPNHEEALSKAKAAYRAHVAKPTTRKNEGMKKAMAAIREACGYTLSEDEVKKVVEEVRGSGGGDGKTDGKEAPQAGTTGTGRTVDPRWAAIVVCCLLCVLVVYLFSGSATTKSDWVLLNVLVALTTGIGFWSFTSSTGEFILPGLLKLGGGAAVGAAFMYLAHRIAPDVELQEYTVFGEIKGPDRFRQYTDGYEVTSIVREAVAEGALRGERTFSPKGRFSIKVVVRRDASGRERFPTLTLQWWPYVTTNVNLSHPRPGKEDDFEVVHDRKEKTITIVTAIAPQMQTNYDEKKTEPPFVFPEVPRPRAKP